MKFQKFHNEENSKANETDTETLNKNVSDNFWMYFLLIWSICMINDAGSVMVMAIAHDLAADFGKVHLMPLFQIFEHSFCILIWFANSRYFIKLKHTSSFFKLKWLIILFVIIFRCDFIVVIELLIV